MREKTVEVLNLKDAMDNLAAIASINMDHPPPLGIVKKDRFVTSEEELDFTGTQWLSAEGVEPILDLLDATYRTVYHHLMSIYERVDTDFKTQKSCEGIAAIMALVGESAAKMDLYLAYRLEGGGVESIRERPSFIELQRFYSKNFVKKVTGGVEGKEAWQRQWKGSLLEGFGTELKDFEALKADREYEFFYIVNEDGEPYLSRQLLRNIKLTADFDASGVSFEDDPFLKIRAMSDRDIQAAAQQIRKACEKEIEHFYKIAKKAKDSGLAQALGKSLIALFLTGNPRYLLQHTTKKNCSAYFNDFLEFLRSALKNSEYQKWMVYPPARDDKIANALILLSHQLCSALFHRSCCIIQETIGLIHRSMRKGEELSLGKYSDKGETIWRQLLLDDEKLRFLFIQFPNGPLFKTLDLIRKSEDEKIPFDPMMQGNLPSHLFEISRGKKKIQVLKMASPTRQADIRKAEVISEFFGFLRGESADGKEKRHLLVNLQDRTSLREQARCNALESLHVNDMFSSRLFVLTLPKDTDFYHQINGYANMHQADDFIMTFKQQLTEPEKSGFYFPNAWEKGDVMTFAGNALLLIHKVFFQNQDHLSRREREDFIEIFYQMLILKAIDSFKVDSVSFTCKDGVDAGASATGTFYGFMKLCEKELLSKEELDFFRFLMYAPALFVRERTLDSERFHRTLSALECMEKASLKERKKLIT